MGRFALISSTNKPTEFQFLVIQLHLSKIFMYDPQTSNSHALSYKILTTAECISYLHMNGIIHSVFNVENLLSERRICVYRLAEGEVAVVEAHGRADYPAIIFRTIAGFEQCITDDYFPIIHEQQSWLEKHAQQTRTFLSEPEFYIEPLRQRLGRMQHLETNSECEKLYNNVFEYINNNYNDNDKNVVGHCFALAMGRYLITKENYPWYLQKKYTVYNPYYDLIIVKEYMGHYWFSNINDTLSFCMRSATPSFKDFYNRVTHTHG